MQHGRDHDEREQKHGPRIEEPPGRGPGDEEIEELDRRARSENPAPTKRGVEEERSRHARQGTIGGNVGKQQSD